MEHREFGGYFGENVAPDQDAPRERSPQPLRRQLAALTEIETLNLYYLSHGLTEQMTADARGVSVYTVNQQVKIARFKLNAKNAAHAVALAFRAGLIT